jgi:hypothetical protein
VFRSRLRNCTSLLIECSTELPVTCGSVVEITFTALWLGSGPYETLLFRFLSVLRWWAHTEVSSVLAWLLADCRLTFLAHRSQTFSPPRKGLRDDINWRALGCLPILLRMQWESYLNVNSTKNLMAYHPLSTDIFKTNLQQNKSILLIVCGISFKKL